MQNQGLFIVTMIIVFACTIVANRKVFKTKGDRAVYICVTGLTVCLLIVYAFRLHLPSLPGWLVERTVPVFTKFTKG
ncbi:hypothetical protein [Paenibacillus sp. MBLB4367]|uniref:hypothetical protein n=1 Tax=Paenibacillus sp. MBLB4367 TaxID=3384767 RepID=UPI003907EF5D